MLVTVGNTYATYELIDDIIYITYRKNVILNLQAAEIVIKDQFSLHSGLKRGILCDIRHVKAIDKAARVYMAREGSILVSALALIVDSPVSIMMSEFYLKTSNSAVPTASFKSTEEALLFLNKYKVL
ncbi:hypothetical protein IZU89_12310 [Cellulophaga lytica]|nr:hypothetical protein QYR09_01985 [Cellulophaga lytica]